MMQLCQYRKCGECTTFSGAKWSFSLGRRRQHSNSRAKFPSELIMDKLRKIFFLNLASGFDQVLNKQPDRVTE